MGPLAASSGMSSLRWDVLLCMCLMLQHQAGGLLGRQHLSDATGMATSRELPPLRGHNLAASA